MEASLSHQQHETRIRLKKWLPLPSPNLANVKHKAENKLRYCVFELLERGFGFQGPKLSRGQRQAPAVLTVQWRARRGGWC
jgi:hypothetical protein